MKPLPLSEGRLASEHATFRAIGAHCFLFYRDFDERLERAALYFKKHDLFLSTSHEWNFWRHRIRSCGFAILVAWLLLDRLIALHFLTRIIMLALPAAGALALAVIFAIRGGSRSGAGKRFHATCCVMGRCCDLLSWPQCSSQKMTCAKKCFLALHGYG